MKDDPVDVRAPGLLWPYRRSTYIAYTEEDAKTYGLAELMRFPSAAGRRASALHDVRVLHILTDPPPLSTKAPVRCVDPLIVMSDPLCVY